MKETLKVFGIIGGLITFMIIMIIILTQTIGPNTAEAATDAHVIYLSDHFDKNYRYQDPTTSCILTPKDKSDVKIHRLTITTPNIHFIHYIGQSSKIWLTNENITRSMIQSNEIIIECQTPGTHIRNQKLLTTPTLQMGILDLLQNFESYTNVAIRHTYVMLC